MNLPFRHASLMLTVLLSACSLPDRIAHWAPTPYRIDVQQGNVITQEMVDQLKPGMTRSQVRFILGTPPLVDPFRTNRWDYVYFYKKDGTITEQRKIAVVFENDRLLRLEGDVTPKEAEADSEKGQ
jgi:outer membrane protein assembly factor BamE